MAAGGYKEFVAGETLDQDEINDYLMQGMLVFAGTAARGSAIGTPVEGQFSFLKDSDTVEFYDGSTWTELSAEPPVVEWLVVAGGAGGSWAGSGAGGLLAGTVSTAGTVAITVGAGGASISNSNNTAGNEGNSSRFIDYVCRGGGGAGAPAAAGQPGGSGGGTERIATTNNLGTYRQGNDGGSGVSNAGGGGGGAGAAGATTASSSVGGNGGVGSIETILSASQATSLSVGEVSGSDVYFAGGGGSWTNSGTPGTGGLGGGGDGVSGSSSPNNGAANTGGGSGGTNITSQSSGTGGSGVVVLKVPEGTSMTFSGGVTQSSNTSGGFTVYAITATSTTDETVIIG